MQEDWGHSIYIVLKRDEDVRRTAHLEPSDRIQSWDLCRWRCKTSWSSLSLAHVAAELEKLWNLQSAID